MDRRSFRHILMKSDAGSLTRTLRSVDVLKSLSVGQLQRLEDILTEVKYKDGEYVIRQVRPPTRPRPCRGRDTPKPTTRR